MFTCMQSLGTMAARGIRLGSEFEEGPPRLLHEGAYHNMVHATVGDRQRHRGAGETGGCQRAVESQVAAHVD